MFPTRFVFLLIIPLSFVVLFCPSCTWRSAPQRSILVVLVENLGFGAFSCSEGAESGRRDGFQTFCDQGVRFTHAYAPSTMSQATIASVFTGLAPYEHGVRHNGAQSLTAKIDTVAEVALSRGYRTSFFSGGPPVWRRSGLNQGFEIFDDAVQIGLKSLYRPASEVVRQFLSWHDAEAAHEKSLSFLYLSDLQFIDAPTTNELGEVRESSVTSQMEAVDEALAHLVKELKRRKIWDETDVLLVGLQGDSPSARPEEIPAMNLMSESTRVTLMIKPARKARDGNFNWKIDANVSLIDIGATLFEMIGAPREKRSNSGESLRAALTGPQPDWPHDRMIITESAWAQWRGMGPIRAAVRQGPYLFVYDDPPLLFNTLTDNLETNTLSFIDSGPAILRSKFSDDLRARGYTAWKNPERRVIERYALARELWRDREPTPEVMQRLRALAKRYPDDAIFRGWRAIWAVRTGDWSELRVLAAAPPADPVWEYVALRNLAEKATVPVGPCFEFLKAPAALSNPQLNKDCQIEGLADLLAWANEAASEAQRTKAMDQFTRNYLARALAMRVSEQNQAVGARWDSTAIPNSPDVLDLILSLPEFRKNRSQLKSRIVSERH